METIQEQKNKDIIYIFNLFFVFIFVLFATITPADSLDIKIISLLIILTLNLPLIFRLSFKRKFYAVGFHVFIFPMILLIFSFLNGGSLFDTLSNVYLPITSGLVIVILYREINFEKYLLMALKIISLLIVGSVIFDVFGILDIYNNSFLMYLYTNQEAMIGKSPLYWSYYMLYFKASPLILILLGHSLFQRKSILVLLSSLALFLSGTRANFFATIFMISMYVFIFQKKKIYKILAIMGLLVIIILYVQNINDYFSYMFISKAESGLNKMDDLKEIFSVFNKHMSTIIFGTGFGTDAKFGISHGTAEYALFDMWRKNGIIGLSMLLYFVLKPIRILWKNKQTKWVVLSYCSYLFVAMTNPLFFSSTAYVMYVFVYFKYYNIT